MAKGGNKRRLSARRCSRKRLTSSKFPGNQYKKKKIQETVGNISKCLADVDSSNENFSEPVAAVPETSNDINTSSTSARKLHLCQENTHIETPVEEEATVNGRLLYFT